ncbi:IS256 family transposase [Oligella ureolytica]
MTSGWLRRVKTPTKPLIRHWQGLVQSTPKLWSAWSKTVKACSAFYDFPAEHWVSIRTTNPIESAFATVRLRTSKTRNCGSRNTTLAMVYKLLQSAQKRWNRLKGFNLLTLVVNNVKFQDGEQVMEQSDRKAA